MSTAARYIPHYTVADYQSWRGDWELWNGVAVAMTPSPFGGHAKLLVSIAAELKTAIDHAQCDATVLAEIDWILSNDTVLRPDLTVVCGDAPEKHVEQTPAMVVEILSPATRDRDLTFKKEIYRQQGVAWYLIADADASTLDVFQLNSDGQYLPAAASDAISITLCEHCSFRLEVRKVFR